MNLSPIPKPGTTGSRKRFWDAAFDSVMSLRKVAGKNVTVSEYEGKGTIVNVDRCCEPAGVPCALPTGDHGTCPHAVCFQVNLQADDTSGRDVCDLQSGTNILLGIFSDGTHWNLYTFVSTSNYIGPVVTTGVWHSFVLQLYTDGFGTIQCDWSVDGVAQTTAEVMDAGETPSLYLLNNAIFGARYGTGTNDRQLRNIALKANPATSEVDFSFPPDSFTNLLGGITAVAGVLTPASSVDSFAELDLDPPYDLLCTTPEGCLCIRNIVITVDIEVTHGLDGLGHACDLSISHSETLVSQFGEDLCGCSFGPFNFTYSEGTFSILNIGFGVSGTPPPPIVLFYNDVDYNFTVGECSTGAQSFSNSGTHSFAQCDPPGTITEVLTDSLGNTVTFTITLS